MAQGTHVTVEIRLRRSIVHVDVVGIREQNLQLAQCVIKARLLADANMGFTGSNCAPVYSAR